MPTLAHCEHLAHRGCEVMGINHPITPPSELMQRLLTAAIHQADASGWEHARPGRMAWYIAKNAIAAAYAAGAEQALKNESLSVVTFDR